MGIVSEFKEFLAEYKVMGLAVAFIMGGAITVLVQSLVNNIIMPLVTFFIPGGAWQTATFAVGPVIFGWGAFLSALINFLIIALVVFLIAKFVMKEEKVSKK
ncbi:MAG: MscL family protein [Candidatus Micrarchaeia archaeon]